MEPCIESENLGYNMVKTASSHYGIKLESADKKENGVMHLDDK